MKIHIKLEFEKEIETIPDFRGAVMALVKINLVDGRLSSVLLSRINTLKKQVILPG